MRKAAFFHFIQPFHFVLRLAPGILSLFTCWIGSAYRRSLADTKLRWGSRGLLANLGEPRMSACLSVDSALARLQELRQIRGTHSPLP